MSDVAAESALGTADILQVMRMIPHRYPMLLVDKVVDMRKDESATGIKNVTINEPYFQGHFPTQPVMPGVSFGRTRKPKATFSNTVMCRNKA